MKLIVDTEQNELRQEINGEWSSFPLFSKEAFELLSYLWVKLGWNGKYTYRYSWLGRPIIQLPEDMVRAQEVIYRVKPDVIIETGIAHGGSLIYYASLCKALGKGRVIGIDVEIRPHNRKAIESHELFSFITLIEGDSVAPDVVDRVKSAVNSHDVIIVILDSCHTKQHVLAELEAYHSLLSPASYIAVTDGIMKDLSDVPRGKPEWIRDNPASAVVEFVQKHPNFEVEHPVWPFNESELSEDVTYWPGAWIRRKR